MIILSSYGYKTSTLHDLGTGHPGTLETTNRSADPPGDYVPPVHRPPIHGDERQPSLLHGEVPHGQFFPSNNVIKIKNFRNLNLINPPVITYM